MPTQPGPVLVLHTTEGTTAAGAKATMDANKSWSHWLTDPKPGIDSFETLIDPDRDDDGTLDTPARSLRNLAGDGYETNNRGGVYQLEIVGSAGQIAGYSDQWYANLAARIRWICDTHHIPKIFPFRFRGSDAYGTAGKARITRDQWLTVTGIIGHQHVPGGNDHWDPGPIDLDRLTAHLNGPRTMPTATKETEFQQALVDLGFDPGKVDGKLGPITAAAGLAATAELAAARPAAARYAAISPPLGDAHAVLVAAGLFTPTDSWDRLPAVLRRLTDQAQSAAADPVTAAAVAFAAAINNSSK